MLPSPVDATDHVRGPVEAPLTIIQYGDYDCPYTRSAHEVLARLLPPLGDKVRFVFRHFPLRHLHENAEVLAEIVEAAAAQGKFWPMHDHLMAHRRPFTPDRVLASATDVGVARDQVNAAVGTPAIKARVQRDVDSGKASGVHSTPTFFFNDRRFEGHADEKSLGEQITQAMAASGR